MPDRPKGDDRIGHETPAGPWLSWWKRAGGPGGGGGGAGMPFNESALPSTTQDHQNMGPKTYAQNTATHPNDVLCYDKIIFKQTKYGICKTCMLGAAKHG